MIRHGISVKLEHVQRHSHHHKHCRMTRNFGIVTCVTDMSSLIYIYIYIYIHIGERAYEWFNVDKMKHANKEHTADIWCHKNYTKQNIHNIMPFLSTFQYTAFDKRRAIPWYRTTYNRSTYHDKDCFGNAKCEHQSRLSDTTSINNDKP